MKHPDAALLFFAFVLAAGSINGLIFTVLFLPMQRLAIFGLFILLVISITFYLKYDAGFRHPWDALGEALIAIAIVSITALIFNCWVTINSFYLIRSFPRPLTTIKNEIVFLYHFSPIVFTGLQYSGLVAIFQARF
ncbi:MAG TPA: hypothetical protein VGD65_20570 [Chryseosolibacter sp.]